MKAGTKKYIGSFEKLATKPINGVMFTSWRTPDNKRFYLTHSDQNINVPAYGRYPDDYEVSYILLGYLDMVK